MNPHSCYQFLTRSIVCASGIVEKTGPGVTRFKPEDRILFNTSGVLRNDSRFGAYQRYCLVPEKLASKVTYFVNSGPINISLIAMIYR